MGGGGGLRTKYSTLLKFEHSAAARGQINNVSCEII